MVLQSSVLALVQHCVNGSHRVNKKASQLAHALLSVLEEAVIATCQTCITSMLWHLLNLFLVVLGPMLCLSTGVSSNWCARLCI